MFGSQMNKNKILYLIFFINCLFNSLYAQRISDFNLSPQNDGINVSFSIGSGSDCSGYSILHCLDSVSYVEIYNYAGICGTSPTKEFKSYLHITASYNQVNYYKIQLYPYEIAYNKILYSNSAQGYLLAYPNPVSQENLTISFKIPSANNIKLEGYICDAFGLKIQDIETQSQGDLIQISVSGFIDGIYLIWLSDGVSIYSTKFIVL